MTNYMIAQLDDIEAQECPCGATRRAFITPDNDAASMHLLDVSKAARVHYHEEITEIYLILDGEGHLELDGEKVPVEPFTAVMIKPGCRHRAVGEMRVAIVAMPPFDPADEWFGE